jgi:hypothetical protein
MAFQLPPDLRPGATPHVAQKPQINVSLNEAVTPAPPVASQEVIPPISSRQENGRFLPGQSGNPLGRPKDATRKFKARAAELMRQHTIEQIKRLITSGEIERMSTWDAIILRNIAAAYTQGGKELRILLEYTEGKAQPAEKETDPNANIYNQTIFVTNYV